MDTREIAKELAVACLSHAHFAATFRPVPTVKYKSAGERVGEFYNGIWKELQKELSDSSKPAS
jgi:hypothetical protein